MQSEKTAAAADNNDKESVASRSWNLPSHLSISRFDHWVKNIFVLPGIVVALSVDPTAWSWSLIPTVLSGLLAIGFVASSNYVINEVLDAPYDRLHPTKRFRPVPAGKVNIPLAYAQWLAMGALGIGLGLLINLQFASALIVLWVMGCIYNIPPLRSKNLPYVDVLSEAVNNPLRMLAGWYLVRQTGTVPATLLICYWMIGCYLMALKRFSEYNSINDGAVAADYRRSFAYYNVPRLLSSVVFYASAAMLFFGAFIMRYRLELVLCFPFAAWVMAVYFHLAWLPNSPVQAPENLYREPLLMVSVFVCVIVMIILLFVPIPALHEWLAPWP